MRQSIFGVSTSRKKDQALLFSRLPILPRTPTVQSAAKPIDCDDLFAFTIMNENATLESHFGGSWWRKDEVSHINLAAGFYSDGDAIDGWWIKVRPRRVIVIHADLHTGDDEMADFRAALSWAEKLSRDFQPSAATCSKNFDVSRASETGRPGSG